MLVGGRRRFLHRSLPGGVVLEALAGDGRLLFSGRIRFCVCPCLVPLHRPGRFGRRLAVTLPLYYSGGCFATVVLLWRMLCRQRCWVEFTWGGCFAAAVGWSGGCFAILFLLQIFAPLAL